MKELGCKVLNRRAQHLYDRMAAYLPNSGTILDVGSGTGHNGALFEKHTKLRVVETDVIDLSIGNKKPILFDGTHLPFKDKSFSGSVLLFMMHYPKAPLALLIEVRRVTNGQVIILQTTYRKRVGYFVYRLRSFLLGPLAYLTARANGLVKKQPFSCLYPRNAFKQQYFQILIEKAGFYIVESIPEFSFFNTVSRDLYIVEKIT